jgi:hypothetical protein
VNTSGVLAGKTLTQITAGIFSICMADTVGAHYCWDDNTYGQLGDNDSTGGTATSPLLTGPQAPAAVTTVPDDTAAREAGQHPARRVTQRDLRHVNDSLNIRLIGRVGLPRRSSAEARRSVDYAPAAAL